MDASPLFTSHFSMSLFPSSVERESHLVLSDYMAGIKEGETFNITLSGLAG